MADRPYLLSEEGLRGDAPPLAAEDAGDIAADFVHRVVMATYDGSENKALATVMPLLGQRKPGISCRHSSRNTCRAGPGRSSPSWRWWPGA